MFWSAEIGPFRVRYVVAGAKWSKRATYRRYEVTRDGKYVFSWPRWEDAVAWCESQTA